MVDQFSSRLRALRAEKGFSLRALAKMVGVTANAVLRWEKAEVTPTPVSYTHLTLPTTVRV